MTLIVLAPAIAVVIVAYYSLQAYFRSDLPRVGKPGLVGYVSTALRYVIASDKVLQEGWDEFGGKPFIIPTMIGPTIILGPEHIEVFRKSNDTIFNQPMAMNDILQLDYTMNKDQLEHPYHIDVIRTGVTRAIASFIPDILEETELAMQATFDPSNDSKLVTLPVFNTFTHLIARISNRVMVGSQLCRNDEFIHSVVHFAETLLPYGYVLSWLPSLVRPAVYFILSSIFGGQKEPKRFLVPYLKQYLQDRETLREDERPHTISELLIRQSVEQSAEDLAMRVMNLNFGSIHTTSIILTQAVLELSILPKSDLESIKSEVQEVLDAEGGWNKAALAKFRKIDSLLREVGRVYGLSVVGMGRRALRDTVLPDGTRIRAGCRIDLNTTAAHFNEEIYPNPHVFDAFRFSRPRKDEDSDVKHRFTTIDDAYLPFGTGRHACPGRFFAAMNLKVFIACLLLNYNFSLPPGVSGRPKNIVFNTGVLPDGKAELVFKRK